MERAILHSDLNCFYASVEMMLDPRLRDKAVAVCGCTEDRHGIVLAKSEKAKRAGVKTGMVNWEAQRCCKDLIIVPPQYDQYLKYSKLTQAIYQRCGIPYSMKSTSAMRSCKSDTATIILKRSCCRTEESFRCTMPRERMSPSSTRQHLIRHRSGSECWRSRLPTARNRLVLFFRG